MNDIIACLCLAALFGMTWLYVVACNGLKGEAPCS